MPTMRISLLNVGGDMTPLKFRGWLRKEAIDIQSTARNEEDIITIRLFITEKLRFAITQVKLDKMLNAVVDKHPNIYRVELEVGANALTHTQMNEAKDEGRSDLRRMVDEIQTGPKVSPTFH
jgi:hypothetical protein